MRGKRFAVLSIGLLVTALAACSAGSHHCADLGIDVGDARLDHRQRRRRRVVDR